VDDDICNCGKKINLIRGNYLNHSTKVGSHNLLHKFADIVVSALTFEWERKSIFYRNYVQHNINSVHIGRGVHAELDSNIVSHNKVKVQALCEPLKVRTITVGTARNFLLKPLQKAMLESLRSLKQMSPCFTPDYQDEINELSQKEGDWLSGDYTSATDALHSDLFRSGLSSLKDYLPEELWDLVERESGPHLCEYPEKYGIEPTWQTNGQLMGSLLSFPLLSLANAFTLSHTLGKPIEQLPALFHGDDLLAKVTHQQYEQWKAFCPTIGLSLSIGKNYFSPNWGSIDSQVYYETEKLGTGKFNAINTKNVQSIPTLVKRGVPKPLIVSLFKKQLTWTPRSLDVATEFGGLGIHGEPKTVLETAVFHRKIHRTFKRRGTTDSGFSYTIDSSFKEGVVDSFDSIDIPEDVENQYISDFKGLKRYHNHRFQNFEIPDPVTVYVRKQSPLLENLIRHSRALYSAELTDLDF
jgi:hypothetical protein